MDKIFEGNGTTSTLNLLNQIIDGKFPSASELYPKFHNPLEVKLDRELVRSNTLGGVSLDQGAIRVRVALDLSVDDELSLLTYFEEFSHALHFELNQHLRSTYIEMMALSKRKDHIRALNISDKSLLLITDGFKEDSLKAARNFLEFIGQEEPILDISDFTEYLSQRGCYQTGICLRLANYIYQNNLGGINKDLLEKCISETSTAMTDISNASDFRTGLRIEGAFHESAAWFELQQIVAGYLKNISSMEVMNEIITHCQLSDLDTVLYLKKVEKLCDKLTPTELESLFTRILESPTPGQLECLVSEFKISKKEFLFDENRIFKGYREKTKEELITEIKSKTNLESLEYSSRQAIRAMEQIASQYQRDAALPRTLLMDFLSLPIFDDFPSNEDAKRQLLANPQYMSLYLSAIMQAVSEGGLLENQFPFTFETLQKNVDSLSDELYGFMPEFLSSDSVTLENAILADRINGTLRVQNSWYGDDYENSWESYQRQFDLVKAHNNLPTNEVAPAILSLSKEYLFLVQKIEELSQISDVIMEPVAKVIAQISTNKSPDEIDFVVFPDARAYSPILAKDGNTPGTELNIWVNQIYEVFMKVGKTAIYEFLGQPSYEMQRKYIDEMLRKLSKYHS